MQIKHFECYAFIHVKCYIFQILYASLLLPTNIHSIHKLKKREQSEVNLWLAIYFNVLDYFVHCKMVDKIDGKLVYLLLYIWFPWRYIHVYFFANKKDNFDNLSGKGKKTVYAVEKRLSFYKLMYIFFYLMVHL